MALPYAIGLLCELVAALGFVLPEWARVLCAATGVVLMFV